MRVAIAGYGAEGQSSYRYYLKQGDDVTIVTDRVSPDYPIPDGAMTRIEPNVFETLSEFDIVVRTPPLPPMSIHTNGKIWSQTNEFLEKCPVPIIGVTGSKGKGTMSSLAAAILRAGGFTVHLVGNIGAPALDVLPNIKPGELVVYELSSFQLWDAVKSPHVAILGMIEPDHLEVHKGLDDYIGAKANITKYQTPDDILVFNQPNAIASKLASTSQATMRPYPSDQYAHVKDGVFCYAEQTLCSVDALRLPGMHNLENACAAINAAWSWVQDGATIAAGLSSFEGLPHRLKLVREVNGVHYYDDSIATTPGSAIAALAAFWQQKIMILGGSSKGADFKGLAEKASSARLKQALLIGDEADTIAAALDEYNMPYEKLGSDITMEAVVQRASKLAQSGDIVILSPACASFGMFKNYAERGEQFISAVKSL